MTINELVFELVTKGGAIVSTADCSNHEIADAQVYGRFAVTDDGLGFVRRPKEWLEINKNRELAHPNTDGRFDAQPPQPAEGPECATPVNPTPNHPRPMPEKTKPENPPANPIDLLERALPFIQEGRTIQGYGFHRPANPNDFFPDHESCSPQEIENHKAACEAWNRGEYKPNPDDESGWCGNMHLLKAPWGIGSYSYMTEDAAELVKQIEILIRARQGGAS